MQNIVRYQCDKVSGMEYCVLELILPPKSIRLGKMFFFLECNFEIPSDEVNLDSATFVYKAFLIQNKQWVLYNCNLWSVPATSSILLCVINERRIFASQPFYLIIYCMYTPNENMFVNKKLKFLNSPHVEQLCSL